MKDYAELEKRPEENFHPGEFIVDELRARGWTVEDLVAHADATALEGLALLVFLSVQKKNCRLGESDCQWLARGFGVSPEYFANHQAMWLANPNEADPFEVEDALWGGYGNCLSRELRGDHLEQRVSDSAAKPEE